VLQINRNVRLMNLTPMFFDCESMRLKNQIKRGVKGVGDTIRDVESNSNAYNALNDTWYNSLANNGINRLIDNIVAT
jgi:uncharacterized protein YeeX (DUF496 family)